MPFVRKFGCQLTGSKMKLTKIFLYYLLVLFILLTNLSFNCQSSSQKGNLKVVVNNIHSLNGQVGFFLFNSEIGFPSHFDKSIKSAYVKINANYAEYTFPDIATGTYAVFVFHDENSDKKLNSNFIGMPKEGMAVSNNAKGHFGPPKYEDAKFDFNKPEQTITISLTYL
jgi:uncharacterized protein (DUF2141 family)